MDVITETSLEALIQRATDPRNKGTDTAAIDAFCGIIKKEPDGSLIASKLIASKIQSPQEWEALQGLAVLEACMKNCGPAFHSEIGKFRFLNEMIKLVSPKFLGSRTPPPVRNQVLKLMYSWTLNYPKEPKIKEAYDMLKKQGVVDKDDPGSEDSRTSTPHSTPKANPLFQDEEKARLLQKLLHSKNPDDLQAANRLIKSMVKEDERRGEMKSKRLSELETVKNNMRLLSEMLDSYRPNQASSEELELIKELHEGCERLRPNVFRLAAETQDNDEMLNQVLSVSDELGQVFDKYTAIIVLGKKFEKGTSSETSKQVSALLDLSTPSEECVPLPVHENKNSDILCEPISVLDLEFNIPYDAAASASASASSSSKPESSNESNLNDLGAIFGLLGAQNNISTPALFQTSSGILHSKTDQSKSQPPEKNSKLKALEDLDVLGETLLQQCKLNPTFASSKSTDKPSLSSLINATPEKKPSPTPIANSIEIKSVENGDDAMMDLADIGLIEPTPKPVSAPTPAPAAATSPAPNPVAQPTENRKLEVKPLTDITVTLESIKPSSIPPINVIEEKNGVTVMINFAKDTPREDVSVMVVTTLSKNPSPISNYLFQAVVPKGCKLKLQPPSGSDLPAHNPFLPPSAITQIMLIANPNKVKITLKCMISYTMDDETVTEMGEVESLPIT